MKQLFNYIMQGTIIDVMVSGYIDTETLPVFHPMYERIYFIINENIFELYIDDDGIIQHNNLKNINLWFDIDEDDQFSLMSIYSQLFKTEHEIKVMQIDYKAIPFSNIKINYKDGQEERQLFLDPNNFFGFTYYN
ncbi:hypothetical protein [Gilliamella apicola]|uniref:hypothetical protein n=1 Tax=Gilliamella apicola TaxID=1196095 RepID=UPI00080DCE8D|nr:hypothetical protein [Gilliamella apicola]OCG10541.1 hypothetical protein A9G14_09965 [Gilliamella apicola]ORF44084.1 hypothetical protein B5800_12830 [Gilliamella apicola]ORF44364.1 hypothetical protein B5803_13760 [Gilliamella apicola]ORF47454.1 hypothetical protein B5799_12525 [Gilliamella apicola]ORF51582.1 hypothetical protein B5798_13220 [Gilliamella apicola]